MSETRTVTRDEALTLNRVERGRDLYDGEIEWYLADRQTPIRHGTAELSTEIAAQLYDRLLAEHRAVTPDDTGTDPITGDEPKWIAEPGHVPGDPHRYRITCEVCGEVGTIRLSVDPETVPQPDTTP